MHFSYKTLIKANIDTFQIFHLFSKRRLSQEWQINKTLCNVLEFLLQIYLESQKYANDAFTYKLSTNYYAEDII